MAPDANQSFPLACMGRKPAGRDLRKASVSTDPEPALRSFWGQFRGLEGNVDLTVSGKHAGTQPREGVPISRSVLSVPFRSSSFLIQAR